MLIDAMKMILEKEIFKEFGYWPKDLKSQSHKKVLAKCEKCGKIREITFQAYRDLCFCCGSRTEKKKNKISNALKGKSPSEETKQKMRNARKGGQPTLGKHFSEETKLKMRLSRKGKHHSTKTKEKIRIANKGKPRTDEFKERMRGFAKERFGIPEKHPMWGGGLSYEPYCIKFNDEFRERVREYWDRKCVLCNKTEKQQMNEMKENGKRVFQLAVHHVTYNKNMCCDDSKPLFVALCASCHAKTNRNREFWKKCFEDIVSKQNKNEKCFYTKEEMNGRK